MADRFLYIHPFDNGNGRTARAILRQQIHDLHGVDEPAPVGKDNEKYYRALQAADLGHYTNLSELIESNLAKL